MRVLVATALTAAIIAALPASPRAEPAAARSRCFAGSAESSDARLAACGAVIASGEETPQGLAAAYLARADAYEGKAQWDFDAYLDEGKYEDRAIADYGEAIRLDPNNAAAFRNRGVLNTRVRRYDRAIADFTDAIRLDPKVAAALYGRALALRYAGQYGRAVADYRKALALKLDDPSRRQIEMILKQLGAAKERDAAPAVATKR
jgi:tetratricopeptide (TPR) repeat protein